MYKALRSSPALKRREMETETEDVLNLNSKGSVSAAFLAAVIKRFANDILSKKGFILAQV